MRTVCHQTKVTRVQADFFGHPLLPSLLWTFHWAFQCQIAVLFLIRPPSRPPVKLGNITLLLFHAHCVLFAFLIISVVSWNQAVINSLEEGRSFRSAVIFLHDTWFGLGSVGFLTVHDQHCNCRPCASEGLSSHLTYHTTWISYKPPHYFCGHGLPVS